MTLCQDKKHLI